MRKFLSLVLALVMMMSLVTINAGAKEFGDADDITYDEAVDVISTIHVVDGYNDGSFKPSNNLSRGAAAKIICNMILGPTTAAELHADTAPYRDVAVTSEFAGYIAYCQKEGIISGYADGTFRPAGTLTGYAFMKMLLGALGYDGEIEQYTGPNWSINVAKRAIGIGLNKGLEKTFNGVDYVTREEAALYAFNTLQADLVKYDQKITATVNGAEVTVGNSLAESRKWDSQATRINNIREDDIIQFAEEYFNKLEKKPDTDDFERPAHTWLYDKDTVGTYVEWELLLEEYTTEVTGRDLYDRITKTVLDNNDLVYYVNGEVPTNAHPMNQAAIYSDYTVDAGDNFDQTDLVRSNTTAVGITDDGVLTQVFLDKDKELITIVSINTWLAQASADYSEDKEYAPLDVFTGMTGTSAGRNKRTIKTSWNVDVEDVGSVVDVKDDDFYLVQISFKDEVNGLVVTMDEPEVLSESTVTKFSKIDENIIDKLTTGGTEYKHAQRAFYSDDALDEYDQTLLTNKTYDVFMDPYGFAIGVALHEGDDNYVFITAFDRPTSNRAISTAKADGIFLDGTMSEMTVNVTDTNKNIRAANTNTRDSYQYFIEWNEQDLPGNDGCYRYNRWFTFSQDEDGTYTLTPATRMNAHKYAVQADAYNIRTSDLYVDDNVYVYNVDAVGKTDNATYSRYYQYSMNGMTSNPNSYENDKTLDMYTATKNERSYANDDSVFLTVDLDDTDTSGGPRAITEVTGVYTGVENVEMEVVSENNAQEAEIYTVYNADHYIIGAVVIGEANGGNANVAYVLSGAKSEERKDGVYYWEFDAVLDGTIQTLTARSKYTDIFDRLNAENQGKTVSTSTNSANDGLVELRFDKDGYVVSVKDVAEKDIYSFYGDRSQGWVGGSSLSNEPGTDTVLARPSAPGTNDGLLDIRDAKAYRIGVIKKYWNVEANGSIVSGNPGTNGTAGAHHYYDSAPQKLTLSGRTLYVTNGQQDEGLFLASDAKAVVIQNENRKTNVKTEWNSVDQALKHLADHDPSTTDLEFEGEVIAAIGSNGAAKWVVFKTDDTLVTGSNTGATGRGSLRSLSVNSYSSGNLSVTLYGTLRVGDAYNMVVEQLVPGTDTWRTVSNVLTAGIVTGGASEVVSLPVYLASGYNYRVVYSNNIYAYFGV